MAFRLEAGPKWTPLEIFLVSLCVFRHSYSLAPRDHCRLLMNQLGVKTRKNVLYHSHWFTGAGMEALGAVAVEDGRALVKTAKI